MATRRASRRAVRKLVWTERATVDLQQIDDYIAADDPVATARCVDKLLAAAQRAARFAEGGHVVREKGREDIRQVLVKTYRVVYLVRQRQVDVLTVFEGRHLLPEDI
jgi:plasmid stabilization system protein ParE